MMLIILDNLVISAVTFHMLFVANEKDDCCNKMGAVKRCQFYVVVSNNEVSTKKQLSEFGSPPNKLEARMHQEPKYFPVQSDLTQVINTFIISLL